MGQKEWTPNLFTLIEVATLVVLGLVLLGACLIVVFLFGLLPVHTLLQWRLALTFALLICGEGRNISAHRRPAANRGGADQQLLSDRENCRGQYQNTALRSIYVLDRRPCRDRVWFRGACRGPVGEVSTSVSEQSRRTGRQS
jgi:hypothetical protein